MSKVDTLKNLVEEYVTFLNLWEKVSVEEIDKDTIYVANTVIVKDQYGFEEPKVIHKKIKVKSFPHIRVTYYSPKGKWKDTLHRDGFESREFPLHDIDRRIMHYRNKLYNLKKKTDEQREQV